MLEPHPIFGVSAILRDLKALDAAALSASATIAALNASIDLVAREFEPGAARDFLRGLEEVVARFPEFGRDAPLEFIKYQEGMVRLKFAAFTLLKENEIDELFSKHILFALRNGIDIRNHLYMRLLFYEDGIAHGVMRRRYAQLIRGNEEPLGSVTLTMKEELKPEQVQATPSISNWLREYDQFFESFQMRSGFEQANYLSQSPNAKNLNAKDQEILVKLIQLYDFLRFPILQTEIVGSLSPLAARAPLTVPAGEAKVIVAQNPQKVAVVSRTLPKGVTEEEYERIVKSEIRKPAPKAHPPREEKSEAIPNVQVQKPVVVVRHEEHPLKVELEELIDSVIKNVELRMKNVEWLKDPVLAKRFRTIVSARLRDVRDVSETAAMLIRDQKVGGMGLPPPLTPPRAGGEIVDLIMEQIEKAFAEFQEKWRAFEKKRIEEWKQKQRVELEARHAQGVKKEQEELEERYKRLVGVRADAPPRQPAQKLVYEKAAVTLPKPVPPKPAPPLPPKSLPPPPPPTRPIPKAISVPAVSKPVLTSPTPPNPRGLRSLDPSSTPSGRGGNFPPGKVTDVRMPPKLTGPLEELKGLTLEDFRRLGSPQEAAAKISARIEMLGKESLRRRIDGIKAWQVCEVNRIYQAITATSFSERKNMLQVLEERKGRNMPTLTPDEFHVIMELNQKLRF